MLCHLVAALPHGDLTSPGLGLATLGAAGTRWSFSCISGLITVLGGQGSQTMIDQETTSVSLNKGGTRQRGLWEKEWGGGHTRHFPEGRPYAPSARPLSTGVAADGTEDARLKFDSQRNESIFLV